MTSQDVTFDKAVSHISSSTATTSNDVKLEVYANYKMATTAVTPQTINISRPGMFDFQGRAKYDAWAKYGNEMEKAHPDTSKDELAQLAKARYISIAKEKFGFNEDHQPVLTNEASNEPQREKTADELLDEDEDESPPQASASTGGMSVSTMSAQKDYPPKTGHERTLHDLAATGDADGIKALRPSVAELNALDEYGFAPLHLAADKGHANVVSTLLDLGADASLPVCHATPQTVCLSFPAEDLPFQDSEGMTALETAEAVENAEIIKLLSSYVS